MCFCKVQGGWSKHSLQLLRMDSRLEFLHHFFDHSVGGWTELNILLVHVHKFYHFFSGKMGESRAIDGPDLINAAHVGLRLKKLAGVAAI